MSRDVVKKSFPKNHYYELAESLRTCDTKSPVYWFAVLVGSVEAEDKVVGGHAIGELYRMGFNVLPIPK